MSSAHIDTLARDNLPPVEQQPLFVFNLPELQFAAQLNCAYALLHRHILEGNGSRICIRAAGLSWTYADLQDKANRIAKVLVKDMGVVPGNRVLLHAPNNVMMVACWFAAIKVGAIAVAIMPLLRAKELTPVIDKAQIRHALCDYHFAVELQNAAQQCPVLQTICYFNDESVDGLDARMARHSGVFVNANTASDETCIIAFTSGTTDVPKATMHFHRDVMAICACWPRHTLKPKADDVFIGSPPLAFTFGLGGLVLFTAHTSYRALASQGQVLRSSKLRRCISAGEALRVATHALWREATGKVVPSYLAQVVDDAGNPVPVGTVGKQARTDDMIVSSGYNIAGPEVEEALLLHPAVAECAVIGVADKERGQIVRAFVTLRAGHEGNDAMVKALQDFVKNTIAPYKYSRAITFISMLPCTQTGKSQRFRLRERVRFVSPNACPIHPKEPP